MAIKPLSPTSRRRDGGASLFLFFGSVDFSWNKFLLMWAERDLRNLGKARRKMLGNGENLMDGGGGTRVNSEADSRQ